ncbi:MAG TPA: 3-isopropylmalate dehydratase large subunit [Chloroflexota bacterium]|nr:3-isopropylmalate dehydratase large subunit [Chloroflexota bacterium]
MGRTMAEKILARHADPADAAAGDVVIARLDLVHLHDANGQIAFDRFERFGADRVFDRERVVLISDHFAPAKDAQSALALEAMRRFARAQGLRYYFELTDGGIEHTLLPQKGLIAPGELILGADSHTCTAGAFGALGMGMGSTDIAAAMALGEQWIVVPETIRCEFSGPRHPFVTGKDLILSVIGRLGVDGAAYQALEFAGPAMPGFNIDERMALCNMAVEAGAETGMVPPDDVTLAYVRPRALRSFEVALPDEDAVYSARHQFDLRELEPLIAVPYSPGNVVPVSRVAGVPVNQVYIGNCANGTMTDLRQAAHVLGGRHIAAGVRLIVVPATQEIYRQAMREGVLETLSSAGASISMPTCGACCGLHNGILAEGEVAVTTTNRNFRGRMGHVTSQVYLANAYVAAASALEGAIQDPARLVNEPPVFA